MIQTLARGIIAALEKRNAIRPQDRDVYIYGCDILLYTVFSTAGLFAIGFAFSRFWETVVCVCVFYLNQSVGGGYHATTHLRCFLTMAAGLTIFILSFLLPIPHAVDMLLGVLSLAVLYCIPLVLHENKTHLEKSRTQLTKRSHYIAMLQLLIFIHVSVYFRNWVFHSLSMALVLCAFSRCVAERLRRRRNNGSGFLLP